MAKFGKPAGLERHCQERNASGEDARWVQPPERPAEAPRPTGGLQTQPTTLILGIGNTLLGDEAAGPIAVRLLASDIGTDSSFSFLDGGTLGFALSRPIAEHRQLIVIDAARIDAAPGTVRVFEGEAMDRQLRRFARSVHEVGLADLLDTATLSGEMPERRALVGIEPALIDWHDGLSESVTAAMPDVLARVREVLARWRRASEGES